MTHAKAPGKIILFGEHAVVYGQPALAVPVKDFFAEAEVLDINRAGIWISAPDIGLHEELSRLASENPLATLVEAVFSTLGINSPPSGGCEAVSSPDTRRTEWGRKLDAKNGIEIKITSTIPIASGLGSGAAVSVAIIRALSAYLSSPLDDEKVNEIAYKVEKIHHGTPSGIDNTVVTYGKPIFFIKDNPIELLEVATPFTLLIADTGIPAPTKKSVADVLKLWEQNPKKMNALFAAAGSIAKTARQAIEGGHPERLGALMNENHRILQELDVSCQALDYLTEASLNAGALGAKLSGGGRGGNMIALSTKENAPAIAEALLKAGAKNVIVTEIE